MSSRGSVETMAFIDLGVVSAHVKGGEFPRSAVAATCGFGNLGHRRTDPGDGAGRRIVSLRFIGEAR